MSPDKKFDYLRKVSLPQLYRYFQLYSGETVQEGL